MDHLLKLDKISYSYPGGIQAVCDVSLRLKQGGFTALMGANGSGKTTLARIASGVLPPVKGSVLFERKDLYRMNRREIARMMAFVPQNIHVDFPFTCRQIVLMGRYSHLGLMGIEGERDYKQADLALEMTGIPHLSDRMIQNLSGGERQRVFIAQAVASQPQLMILDEPVSALDIKNKVLILKLLRSLVREKGITVLAILHDINMASLFADDIVMLRQGMIVASGPPGEVLTPSVIHEVYDVEVDMIESPVLPGRFMVPRL